MKKLTPLFILMILVFSGCSTESLEDQISSFDAQVKKNQITTPEDDGVSLNYDNPVCAGAEVNLCVSFPQAYKGNGETKTTNVKADLLVIGDDPSTEEIEDEYYLELLHEQANTEACFSHTFEKAGTYTIRYKTEGGWSSEDILVENCGCEESFSYDDAGDNNTTTYTFYYTPAEDMDDATLVFTFAQSVAIDGFPEIENWKNNGNGATSSTNQTTMNLEACHTYEWTLTLEKDCSGHSGKSNLWTDFKVNDVSKKGDLKNIEQSCPQ